MKKILGLTIGILVVIAMVAAGTYAFFNDTQASTGNMFTAGTLDLGLSNTGVTTATGDTSATFTASTWAPGSTTPVGTITVDNTGNLAMGHLTVAFSYDPVDVTNRPTDITGSPWTTPADTDLFDKQITIATATWGGASQASLVGKSLFDLVSSPVSLTPLAAGAHNALALTFTFSQDATNGCQGNILTLTVTFAATQN